MTTRKFYKCFISSPGDCKEEREICQKIIDELNLGLGKHLNVNFETFMWENDVLPDFGKGGQEIIDVHIEKSSYDIFIGIMKNRYGHPTEKAGSGTEHEFNDALERKKNSINSVPKILFFFGKEHVDLDSPNIEDIFEQHKKVKEFKNKISDKGLYVDFIDIDDFQKSLRQKLELFIKENSPLDDPNKKITEIDLVLNKLQDDLEFALTTYNERTPVWIDPIVSTRKDIPVNPTKNEEYKVDLTLLIDNPQNIIIKAPSEFGLTSLAHYLKKEAWIKGKTFLYIDAKKTKKHKIVKDVYNELKSYFNKDVDSLDCILLDSVCFEENGMMPMIKNLCDEFKETPIIIFNTLDNNFFLKSDEDDKVEIMREFIPYYLLPLPQNDLRKIVCSYSNFKCLEDDNDVILNKVTKDLEVLNMHRTPKNCISVLRASSKIGGEYSPINRTKLLEAILNTIFEEYEIPTYYDKKPDIKDCSFVLGYFCELLVLRNDFEFKKDFFIDNLKDFCAKSYITLDLDYLFNVLVDNAILGKKSSELYYFKNSYWVFFFLAQRMNMNKEFLNFIYDNKKYIDFPEIMEFYTGIDRNKEDALIVLSRDIDETLEAVRNKVKIPDDINPFKSISWNPDVSVLEKEEAKIGENVISSGLPNEIKDKYDDKNYNQIRPYHQVINSVIRDYSFAVLMRQISATSRALRNSDFVNPELKKVLLNKILLAWNEINKLLIILSPLLADKGNVAFEGASFYLDEDDFSMDDPDKKRLFVLLAVPTNVVKFFKDDLYSNKMGALIIDKANSEVNSLLKHELILMIIAERPHGWNKIVDNYIVKLDKNSFYLSDVHEVLKFNSEFKSTEVEDKRLLNLLASKCRAKHFLKSNNPDIGLINRLEKLEKGKSDFKM